MGVLVMLEVPQALEDGWRFRPDKAWTGHTHLRGIRVIVFVYHSFEHLTQTGAG